MDKKGFTLIEIIVVISLLAVVAGIFSVSFISILNANRKREYENAITRMETAANAYVRANINSSDIVFSDIQEASNTSGIFTYITLDELVSAGFINEKPKNPNTGEYFPGLIKISKGENGDLKYEYVEPEENYLTIVYVPNGADVLSRYTEVVFISDPYDKDLLLQGVKDKYLPSIIRKSGQGIGWSIDKTKVTSAYYSSTSLKYILQNEQFEIKDNKIYLYAISTKENHLYLSFEGEVVERAACITYNTNDTCNITIPIYSNDDITVTRWSTENGTKTYNAGDKIELNKDLILYSK